MPLITLRQATLGFGDGLLLEEVNVSLDEGERVAIRGRNGAGKSTLLSILAGTQHLDSGEVIRQQNLRIETLPQEVPTHLHGSVLQVIMSGFGAIAEDLSAYQTMLLDPAPSMDHLAELQERLEHQGGFALEQRAMNWISRLDLDASMDFSHLSGGRKRRVLLARALAQEPDILLLDEPTNHLDTASISWLETHLLAWRGSLVVVSHDRQFLRTIGQRFWELDRGRLHDDRCAYDESLMRSSQRQSAEASAQQLFDRRLAEEEVWIRKGLEARRTRNEGRVRALQAMRREKADQRQRQGQASMALHAAERSGRLVLELEHVCYAMAGQPLVDDFSVRVMRGERIGLIGDNGVGKSTLIRLIMGTLQPQSGKITLGTHLKIAYFDQLREALKEEASVLDNVVDGSDYVEINGVQKHAMSYLQDFLFSPRRARTPVKALSGGERNRLLLARLFARPSNLLIMDEPTNDLDLETLELLEDILASYSGTLLLISHDRAFLDAVVTSTWHLAGRGKIHDYIGGYSDFLRQRPTSLAPPPPLASKASVPTSRTRSTKLSFHEQRELAALPEKIARLEEEQAQLYKCMDDPQFFLDNRQAATTTARLSQIEEELLSMLERWDALES